MECQSWTIEPIEFDKQHQIRPGLPVGLHRIRSRVIEFDQEGEEQISSRSCRRIRQEGVEFDNMHHRIRQHVNRIRWSWRSWRTFRFQRRTIEFDWRIFPAINSTSTSTIRPLEKIRSKRNNQFDKWGIEFDKKMTDFDWGTIEFDEPIEFDQEVTEFDQSAVGPKSEFLEIEKHYKYNSLVQISAKSLMQLFQAIWSNSFIRLFELETSSSKHQIVNPKDHKLEFHHSYLLG